MVKEQFPVLLWESVALTVTTWLPIENVDPDDWLRTGSMFSPELSVTFGAYHVTVAKFSVESVSVMISAGHSITGSVKSVGSRKVQRFFRFVKCEKSTGQPASSACFICIAPLKAKTKLKAKK